MKGKTKRVKISRGDFSVVLPSLLKSTGRALRYDNRTFQVFFDLKLGVVPIIDPIESSEPILLDPRAIVFNESSGVVEYSPRYFEAQQAEWVKDYLVKHPNWGQPGCEQDWENAIRMTQ